MFMYMCMYMFMYMVMYIFMYMFMYIFMYMLMFILTRHPLTPHTNPFNAHNLA